MLPFHRLMNRANKLGSNRCVAIFHPYPVRNIYNYIYAAKNQLCDSSGSHRWLEIVTRAGRRNNHAGSDTM